MEVNLPQDVKDRIRCDLYDEFYKKNQKLYGEDSVEYWRQANRYIETHYRNRLEAFARKISGKISKIEEKVTPPTFEPRKEKRHWWQIKKD